MKKAILFAFLVVIIFSTKIQSQIIYSNKYVDLIKLDEKVFLLRENFKFTANCLIIAGDHELLLLDTGFGEIGDHLLDAIEFLEKKVKVIVNSHSHADHMGANALFGKNVTIIGHEKCKEAYSKFGQEVVTFDSNHTFDFEGHLVFCMSYSGGHSACDIVTFIPDLNLAYLGDIYLSESFPLVIVSQGSNVDQLVIHLNEIFESLPEETRLFPGHGKETSMEYLGGYIAMVEETVEIVRKKMKSGKSLREIQAAAILKKWEGWGKFFPFVTADSWIEQIYHSYSK